MTGVKSFKCRRRLSNIILVSTKTLERIFVQSAITHRIQNRKILKLYTTGLILENKVSISLESGMDDKYGAMDDKWGVMENKTFALLCYITLFP